MEGLCLVGVKSWEKCLIERCVAPSRASVGHMQRRSAGCVCLDEHTCVHAEQHGGLVVVLCLLRGLRVLYAV